MATAIHEWIDEAGVARYAASPPNASYNDAGVAFYASAKPAPGLTPIFERAEGGGFVYTPDPGTRHSAPAFYAYSTRASGPVPLIAVNEASGRLRAGGDGTARFFVPCVRRACEESSTSR
jgi:hypothetical protein